MFIQKYWCCTIEKKGKTNRRKKCFKKVSKEFIVEWFIMVSQTFFGVEMDQFSLYLNRWRLDAAFSWCCSSVWLSEKLVHASTSTPPGIMTMWCWNDALRLLATWMDPLFYRWLLPWLWHWASLWPGNTVHLEQREGVEGRETDKDKKTRMMWSVERSKMREGWTEEREKKREQKEKRGHHKLENVCTDLDFVWTFQHKSPVRHTQREGWY